MKEAKSFKSTSQEKSHQAQDREQVTTQPKEEVFGLPKGKVTLSDSKGGLYSWTVDAFYRYENKLFLMEMKHSKGGRPSMDDIKDALFKFHFYGNISDLRDEKGTKLEPIPTLVLTSEKLSGFCYSVCPHFKPGEEIGSSCIEEGCLEVDMKSNKKSLDLIQNDAPIQKVFQEAHQNNILVIAIGKKDARKELISEILASCVKQKM